MPPDPRPQSRAAAGALARIALLAGRWVERLLAPMTVAQYLALRAVEREPLAAVDLARAAAVSPAAVSQLLGTLEEAGLVERAPTEHDRRRHAVAITAAGRRALRAAERRVADPLSAALGELGPREAAALDRALPELEALLSGARPPRRPPPPRHPPPPSRRARRPPPR